MKVSKKIYNEWGHKLVGYYQNTDPFDRKGLIVDTLRLSDPKRLYRVLPSCAYLGKDKHFAGRILTRDILRVTGWKLPNKATDEQITQDKIMSDKLEQKCRNEYRAMKLTQFVRGWVNYFSLADMKGLLRETDEWLRHKIRTIYWKQWKKVRTKFRELKKLGVEEEKAWICANMRNGNWYCGGYFVLQTAFNNKKLRELGYPTFTEFYLKVCEN